MSETSFPKLHALIIGINKYKVSQLQGVNLDLRGCVGDARSMLAYLRYDLQVPPEQIVCLFDHEATRDNIISAFSVHLIQNPKIKPSDPIVIYYAGRSNAGPGYVLTAHNINRAR
jgi:DNA-directed RNA polymerase subunit H (RpoH/RPB5)